MSFAIISAGRFIGVFKRDAAIPIEQLEPTSGNLALAGVTKNAHKLKELPPFEYAKK